MRKKTVVIIIFSFLLVVGMVGTFWGPSIAEAKTSIWDSCPYDEVNDPYPGDCNRYIDTNKDGICDRSQPAPTTAASSTPVSGALVDSSITSFASGVAASAGMVVTNDDSGSTGNTVAGYVDVLDDAVTTTNAEGGGGGGGLHSGRTYYFIPVVGAFILAYALTWILSNRKVFKVLTHRKIWNIVLGVSCLVSAILGLILILNLDFDTNITLPFNTLFWHVEAGLAMAVIAVFHIVWHWRYWIKMFQIKDPNK